MQISDYDKFEYNYKDYWSGDDIDRRYEDLFEKRIIQKNTPKNLDWLCDLGGGFGRLYNSYKNNAKYKILADYSLENLKTAQKNIKDPNLFLVAVNAYHLPFRDDALDFLLSVRLMHHIENIDEVISEISRITKPEKRVLIEYANKRHFFEILRFFVGKSKMSPFSLKPMKRGNDLFYNYHPKYVESRIMKHELRIIKTISSSNFRHKIFKKIFGVKILLFFEKILSPIFNILRFGPSIFVLAQKKGSLNNSHNYSNIQDVLICSKCKSDRLEFSKDKIKCLKCEKNYLIVDGIYDFRVD